MTTISAILTQADAGFDAAMTRWLDWLRIPSISAQPAHAADCRRAAEFARADLESLGFTVSIRETQGQPVVVAHHPGPAGTVPIEVNAAPQTRTANDRYLRSLPSTILIEYIDSNYLFNQLD